MNSIIAMFNQKGGVGKTTSCSNICAALAMQEQRVLAIDFDPQSNLSSGYGIERRKVGKSVYEVLLGDAQAEEAIIPTTIENLSLLPASIDLAGAEIEISNVPMRETVLKRALAPIQSEFDYIFIDCPPSLGLLPVNALAAASGVLIPIQCEYYALEGVSQLINTVNLVKRSLNPRLEVAGVLLTMFDSRTNLSHQVAEEVRNFFGDKVFEAIIPRNVRLAEAPSHGKTILEYDAASKGASAYMNVAAELIARTAK